jgi:DNA-binding NtrC family response regulator
MTSEPVIVRQRFLYEPKQEALRIPCVYLTASLEDALHADTLLASVGMRIQRARSLEIAISLLRVLHSRVLLVDETYPDGEWQEAAQRLTSERPKAVLVVATAVEGRAFWREVAAFGGFDVVIKPLTGQELCAVLWEADRYARNYLSDEPVSDPRLESEATGWLDKLKSRICLALKRRQPV